VAGGPLHRFAFLRSSLRAIFALSACAHPGVGALSWKASSKAQ